MVLNCVTHSDLFKFLGRKFAISDRRHAIINYNDCEVVYNLRLQIKFEKKYFRFEFFFLFSSKVNKKTRLKKSRVPRERFSQKQSHGFPLQSSTSEINNRRTLRKKLFPASPLPRPLPHKLTGVVRLHVVLFSLFCVKTRRPERSSVYPPNGY